ncbi:MAG TPA: hypothetical protein VLZ12_14410 [Verrucomicrobiae bacterium]|nr:hypothetical protein [Verrucomicrobiae bacterium]
MKRLSLFLVVFVSLAIPALAGCPEIQVYLSPNGGCTDAIVMAKHPAKIRVLGMGATGVVSSEGGSLEYLAAIARGENSHDAWVAVSKRRRG